ncbi:MAG: pyrroloquinoline quinone biosynthesis peptide chaperone PqqD [Acetobacteraceae bacterium]|nr:pyrroloquinoline quinone biosynthesis peptide chaperone PqqD [Acetobacteraceae bacterium]
MADSAVPRFATGMKFRFDTVRERWVVLGPERLFLPDETAVEVLKLVDGQRSLDDIADALAARFDAPRETIAVDVAAMLRDLAEKGAIRL